MIPDIGWYATTHSNHKPRNGEHGWDNNASTMKVSTFYVYANVNFYRPLWQQEDQHLRKDMLLVVLITSNFTILNVVDYIIIYNKNK